MKPIEQVRATCRQWFGAAYDLDAMMIALAAAAVERLDGDPLWVLLIGGPGATKTETLMSLRDRATVTSTISSGAALLSGTPKKETTKGATGGLLRVIGERGTLVVKDFTSIISLHRDARADVMAALREVYDGFWQRNIGADGGRSLTWAGRLVVIGACTTAWDDAHGVVAAMGDRFLLVRLDSYIGRLDSGARAIATTGDEVAMRAALADVVGACLAAVTGPGVPLAPAETDRLLKAADLMTLARTAVMTDYHGNVLDAHAPEMPTRAAKQLAQVLRGAVALGIDRADALRLAMRCARDSSRRSVACFFHWYRGLH